MLICVGSIAFDTVETPDGRAEDVLGGSAVYFGFAASLFGPVGLMGVVGADFPEADLERLQYLLHEPSEAGGPGATATT